MSTESKKESISDYLTEKGRSELKELFLLLKKNDFVYENNDTLKGKVGMLIVCFIKKNGIVTEQWVSSMSEKYADILTKGEDLEWKTRSFGHTKNPLFIQDSVVKIGGWAKGFVLYGDDLLKLHKDGVYHYKEDETSDIEEILFLLKKEDSIKFTE